MKFVVEISAIAGGMWLCAASNGQVWMVYGHMGGGKGAGAVGRWGIDCGGEFRSPFFLPWILLRRTCWT